MIVDDAPHGSLLVASRTCQLRSTDSNRMKVIIYLRLHFCIIHNGCEKQLSALKREISISFCLPFCTFRTPAFRSYSVRLLTCSFKLLKSIATSEKVRNRVNSKGVSMGGCSKVKWVDLSASYTYRHMDFKSRTCRPRMPPRCDASFLLLTP